MSHPEDRELIEWMETGRETASPVAAHVAECDACQREIETLAPVFEALRADPEPLSPETAEAARARIRETIDGRAASVRPIRGRRWIPVAAAAAIAAIVLLSLDRGDDRVVADEGDAVASLAVIDEAERAAEEAIAEIQMDADADLEDVGIADLTEVDEYEATTRAFAALSADAQNEILDALEKETFDL